MGLRIALENERGEAIREVLDLQNELHRLLPRSDDESFQLLRFVDWYQDTTFNQLQMPVFLAELRRIAARANTDNASQVIRAIEQLAKEVEAAPHLYVKFYGD
jgi:hypothetical protein